MSPQPEGRHRARDRVKHDPIESVIIAVVVTLWVLTIVAVVLLVMRLEVESMTEAWF